MAENDEQATSPENVSDADIISALGLDANLLPTNKGQATKESEAEAPEAEVRENNPEEAEAEETASGDNAGDEDDAGEEESEGDEDTSEETDDNEDEATPPKGMQKRIDRLTAIRRELEEENAQLKGQLSSAKHPTLTATHEDPLSDLDTDEAVEERIDQMQLLVGWCYENLDGGEMEINGKTLELDGKEVRRRLARANEIITRHAPARKKYLEQRSAWDDQAKKSYPELFDSKSAESKFANAFLRRCPSLITTPDYQMIIGHMIEGIKMWNYKNKQAAKPKQKEQVAPRATKPSQPAQKLASNANGRAPKLRQKFNETGKVSDLADFIATTL